MSTLSPLPPVSPEADRLEALRALAILDTRPEERFDRITRVARRYFGVPVALVSLVDEHRQWFKSNQGLEGVSQTSRGVSFCSEAIKTPKVMVVEDARLDARFADNPLVTGEPRIRFYAGHPLQALDGQRLGTLCVIDTRPRLLRAEDLAMLADLAAMVEAELHAADQQEAMARLREVTGRWREEKEKFDAFLHHSPSIIFMKDAQGRLLYINRQGEEIFGRRLGKLRGLRDDEWLPAEAARQTMENDRQILETGEAVEFAESVPTPGGRTRHWLSFKFPITHSSGARLLGGVAVEVTAQREAEERLRAVTAMQSAVLDHVHASIISSDASGMICTFNPTAERWLGYTAEEAIGKMNVSCLHVAEELAGSAEELSRELGQPVEPGIEYARKQLERAPSFEREWTYVRKDGSRFPVLISVTGLHDEAGNFQGFVGIGRDITRSKLTEAAMREAKEAAEQANAAKSAFVATMSHEVRTPLNGILGLNHMLLDSELTAPQRRVAELLQTSAQSLMGIVSDVLDFSKVEARRLILEEIDFDLPALVESVVAFHRVQSDAKGLELAVRLGDTVPRHLRGDPGRLRQVLQNLIGNAIKFSSRGTVGLEIDALEGTETCLRFAVRDRGIGIPLSGQKRIFEPFSQADGSTTREYGGTGLGLAICRELVHLMRGELEVESMPGEGSTFWFTAVFAPAQGILLDLPAAPEALRSFPGLRVLVAEDCDVNRRVVTYQLEKFGCVVEAVENGHEAIAAILGKAYDLVLMDCQMPVMDGYQAVEEIRRAESDGRHTRIVALTANAFAEGREKCLASGMDGYLSKPFRPADLHRVLAESAPAVEPLEIASLRDDCGGPVEFAHLVGLFRGEVEANVPLLREALRRADAEQFARAAHKLRGAAANFGARRLQEQCSHLERAARSGGLEVLGSRLPEVERTVGEVLVALALECRAT